MTYDEIKTIFDSFIEFPEESDKLTVTTTSCILFARHIAKIAAEREREACAKVCDTFKSKTLGAQVGPDNELSNVMLRQVAHLGHAECAAAIRARITT